MEIFKGISAKKLDDILQGIKDIRVVLIGDICLDVYWKADMTRSELSRETPHFPLPVVEERMSAGGGGNAAVNIAALQPKSIKVLGVIGRDWRGEVLTHKLRDAGIDTEGLTVSDNAVTNAYCKPVRKGISDVEYEDPRIDFCNFENLRQEDEEKLLHTLTHNAKTADLLCVSDQLPFGCITPLVRRTILQIAETGTKVVVDSRDRLGLYEGVTLKPNEVEGMRALYGAYDPEKATLENYAETAKSLAIRNRSKIIMTLGSLGSLYADEQTATAVIYIPSREVKPPVDICGAGDTYLAAFSCANAGGAKAWEAAAFANLAAEVTIQKIGMTGSAAPWEIRDRHMQVFT